MKEKTKKLIEEVMNNSSPSEKLIAAAIKREQEEYSERKIRRIQENLRQIEKHIESSVVVLRNARAIEKKAKEHLQIILDAQEQFMKDADYEAYHKTVSVVLLSDLGYDIGRAVVKINK